MMIKKHTVKIPVTLGPNCNIDLSRVTVTPDKLLKGETAYDKDGNIIVGELEITK